MPDTNGSIEWGDPPPPDENQARLGKWERRMLPLRSRPGEWAKVATTDTVSDARATAQNLKRGLYRGIKPDEFETTYRRTSDDNTAAVWARYIGSES